MNKTLNKLDRIRRACTLTLSVLLDFLFPRGDIDRKIDELTLETLAEHTAIRTAHNDIVVFFYYRDPIIKRMIARLKYHKDAHSTDLLSAYVSDYLLETLGDRATFEAFTQPLLVPIPLSTKRHSERGYNQAERLAETIVRHQPSVGALETHALKKIKETMPQSSLKRRERLINLAGAFEADPVTVQDQNIILIDDVTTTGSTLHEARTALLEAGAHSVMCIAIAG